MLLIGPNGTLSESQDTSQTKRRCNAPKACELLYPMISAVLFKYVRDDLNELRPVFDTCTVTRELWVISKCRLLEDFLRE
jgi:hypothetical protein